MRMGGTVDDIMVHVATFRMSAPVVMAPAVTVMATASPHDFFGHVFYQPGAAPHRGRPQPDNTPHQRDEPGLTGVPMMMIVVMMH